MESDQSSSLFSLNLDAQNSYHLRSAASWAKVLGVLGVVLGIIFTIIVINALSQLGSYNYRRSGLNELFGSSLAATRVGVWILLLTALIFILGGVFSFNFGNRINAALKTSDQQGLNRGFIALRNYYAVRSVTLILILLLFLIGFAGSI